LIGRLRPRAIARCGVVLAAVAALAACGGGGGGSVPAGGPTPSPSPSPQARSSSATVTIGGSTTALAFPPISGIPFAQLVLSTAPAANGAVLNGTLSLDPPALIPPLQSAARAPQRALVRGSRRGTASATHTGVAYISFSASRDVTSNGVIKVSLTLSGASVSQPYYLSFFDGTGWQYDVAGPSNPVSDGTVEFFVQPPSAPTFTGGRTYVFAVTTDAGATPAPAPSPTASPTATPVPTPSPTLPPFLTGSRFRSYAQSGAFPYGILAASDGVWVTESPVSGSLLVKLSVNGQTVQSVGVGRIPASMVYGPDATIWIAINGDSAIEHVSATGQPLAVLPTTDRAGPRRITYAGDARLWYTQDGVHSLVGRMAQTGANDELVVPGAAFGVAAGPDGNVWLAAGTAIDKATTSGSVTAYPLPPAVQSGSATSICAGADGNLWAAVIGLPTPYVLKITPAGAMTGHSIPTPVDGSGWGTAEIACIGSFVYLAATDQSAFGTAIIAQLAADGTVAQLWQIPATGQGAPEITGITLGPDQNLWFVDSRGQTVDVWVQP
jgi:hypothetical protein